MSLLLCRFIHRLHYYPKTILGVTTIITLLSIWSISQLKWQPQLLQLFSEDTPSRLEAERFEDEYGGFGMLTVISQNPEPQPNIAFLKHLAHKLQHQVHFAEFETESSFFEKNKLLYINLKDLESIQDRIYQGIHKSTMRANPFIIPLVENPQDSFQNQALQFKDLQAKYADKLIPYLGSPDQKTLVLRLYPKHDITNLAQNQKLYESVQNLVKIYQPSGSKVSYTGGILENIQNQELVSEEISSSIQLAVLFILGGLLIFFYRQPMIPLLATFPIILAMSWTLGLAALIYGKVNLITLVLGVILIGVGTDSIIHLLARYGEERRKGLGPFIAFENIILETGPTITISTFTTAIGFISLRFLSFEGLKEFGTLAALALILSWLSSMIVFPAVLLLLQRTQAFKVYGSAIRNHLQFEKRPLQSWKFYILLTLVVFVISAQVKFPVEFDQNLEHIGFTTDHQESDKLLKKLGLDMPSPAIFRVSGSQDRIELTEKLLELSRREGSLIHKIQSLENVLPNHQEDKIEVLDEIRDLLKPGIMKKLNGETLENARLIQNSIQLSPLSLTDLPISFKKKFQGRNHSIGEYLFVFPKHNTNEGLLNRQFAAEVRKIKLNSSQLYSTGKSILIADFLETTIPQLSEAITWALIGIFLLLILETTVKDAITVIFCVVLSLCFGIVIIQWFQVPITPLNIFIYPLIIGYCFDGALHIHQRYREEATGSLPFVMRRTGSAVVAAILTTSAGFLGFALSDHPGLQNIGVFALLGTLCSLISALIILPTFLVWGDLKRWRDLRKEAS